MTASYARKSAAQHVVDEEKSDTRLVERARAYAARLGGTVPESHVYRVLALADEIHREQSRQYSRDAFRREAELGHVTGGAVYGYRNVPREGYVDREIVPHEAAVVRRIFQLAAEGLAFARIAKTLTTDGMATPSPQPGRGWNGSTIRHILVREMYRGVIVWNKGRRIARDGTRAKRVIRARRITRPPSEWLRVEAPHLRLIDEALWTAAHAAIDERTVSHHYRDVDGTIGRDRARSVKTTFLPGKDMEELIWTMEAERHLKLLRRLIVQPQPVSCTSHAPEAFGTAVNSSKGSAP